MGRTSFVDSQASIIRKYGLDASKKVNKIYSRVLVAVVSSGVKYDCFTVKSDEDLQVFFHCRQQYLEVRTTELYVEIEDEGASSGGSTPHPQSVHVGVTHVLLPLRGLLQWRAHPHLHLHRSVMQIWIHSLLVEEALRCNDSSEEPILLEGDSDDDGGTISVARDVPSSSRMQEYPPHFSTLNLELGSGVGPIDGDSRTGVHGSHGSNVTTEF
ncbi:hypothetical protein PIB30_049665 [Stylosanthes scabra]|uniref:Uncharacterized protein n=1 Tax=Stylosanthes scabra TaxID=79078 RepID=A0ABU6TH51_9FABA|nr:hypothetical protein [Stylosanthes scabra]